MRGRCCNFRWNAINPNTADVLYIHVSTEINVSETHFKTVLHNDSPLLLLLFSLRPLLPPFYPPLFCTTIFHFFFFIISLKKRLSFFSFWMDEVQVLLFFFSIFSFFFFFFCYGYRNTSTRSTNRNRNPSFRRFTSLNKKLRKTSLPATFSTDKAVSTKKHTILFPVLSDGASPFVRA